MNIVGFSGFVPISILSILFWDSGDIMNEPRNLGYKRMKQKHGGQQAVALHHLSGAWWPHKNLF
jgi:hypothetical protein